MLINESNIKSNSVNDDEAISVFYFEQNDNAKFMITNSIFISNNANIRCGVLVFLHIYLVKSTYCIVELWKSFQVYSNQTLKLYPTYLVLEQCVYPIPTPPY